MEEISFKNDVLPLKDKLFRLALRITSNREEAEDIVQDTLIKLWNQRNEWSAIRNMETYSMTVCRNLALDAINKSERQNISLDETAHDQPDTSRMQDEVLMRQQQMDRIHAIIQQLPEKQRTIILLRDIEEKSYQEIAEIMGINLSDVKVNLFRARQTLKAKINKS
jgi:RNA polymerase sigma-70 factor (ECF subfamily)